MVGELPLYLISEIIEHLFMIKICVTLDEGEGQYISNTITMCETLAVPSLMMMTLICFRGIACEGPVVC